MTIERRRLFSLTGASIMCPSIGVAQSNSVRPQELSTYSPGTNAPELLGDVMIRLQQGRIIRRSFANRPVILAQTSSGELYFDTTYEPSESRMPAQRSMNRSVREPTEVIYRNGQPLNPERVPYFLLPSPSEWLLEYNIQLGDYGAVLFNGRVAFAIFGAFGPPNRLGSGSAALLRALGFGDRASGRLAVNTTEPGVVTIVFPNSGSVLERRDERRLLGTLLERGPELFRGAGGQALEDRVVAPLRGSFEMPKILWVDDHPQNNISEIRVLRRLGFHIEQVRSSMEAFQQLGARTSWSLIISDIGRENQEDAGLSFAQNLRRNSIRTPLIFYSSQAARAQHIRTATELNATIVTTPQELIQAVDEFAMDG